jgi:hypothetical protein
MKKFDKDFINEQARISVEQGRFTEPLGRFTLEAANSYIRGRWPTLRDNWRNGMIDAAVMRVLEEFIKRYRPEKGAASSLIIGLISSAALNQLKSYNWKDELGGNNKTFVNIINKEGKNEVKLVQATTVQFVTPGN